MSIYNLIAALRAHPDYVFGAIFTRADFESEISFDSIAASDSLVKYGNEIIEDSTS